MTNEYILYAVIENEIKEVDKLMSRLYAKMIVDGKRVPGHPADEQLEVHFQYGGPNTAKELLEVKVVYKKGDEESVDNKVPKVYVNGVQIDTGTQTRRTSQNLISSLFIVPIS